MRGGAGKRREVVEVRGDARPPALPGLASGRSLRLLPAPSPHPPVLPSPPVHDGNTMAAAAQLSLTQVTPPAHPPGSVGWCPRPAPSPTALRFTDPGSFSRPRTGRPIVRARACACVPEGGRHPEPAAPPWQPRPQPGSVGAHPTVSPPLRAPAVWRVPRARLSPSRPLSLHSAFTHPGSFLLPGQTVPGELVSSRGSASPPGQPSALTRLTLWAEQRASPS